MIDRELVILKAYALLCAILVGIIIYCCMLWEETREYNSRCLRPVTDMDITYCYGDVDPADPMEDEVQYMYTEEEATE